jgi:hypothetical protein
LPKIKREIVTYKGIDYTIKSLPESVEGDGVPKYTDKSFTPSTWSIINPKNSNGGLNPKTVDNFKSLDWCRVSKVSSD